MYIDLRLGNRLLLKSTRLVLPDCNIQACSLRNLSEKELFHYLNPQTGSIWRIVLRTCTCHHLVCLSKSVPATLGKSEYIIKNRIHIFIPQPQQVHHQDEMQLTTSPEPRPHSKNSLFCVPNKGSADCILPSTLVNYTTQCQLNRLR